MHGAPEQPNCSPTPAQFRFYTFPSSFRRGKSILVMTGKTIAHLVLFLIVAGIVTATFVNVDPDDSARVATQLPVLMLAGLYLGIMFVSYVLPVLTQKATGAVLGSNERVERDPMRDAQAARARGDYEGAIDIYRKIIESDQDPLNRTPWVEIAKIEYDQLKDPEAAIATLSTALEEQEWPADDTAFFMVRMADIQLEDMEDPEQSAAILNEIIEMFPETRYSANATHKLKEMGHS